MSGLTVEQIADITNRFVNATPPPKMEPSSFALYSATNGQDTIIDSLIVNGGALLKDVPEVLYVSGMDAGYNDVVIKTTKKEINELMTVTVQEARRMFIPVSKNVRNKNTDVLYADATAWTNFSNDLIIYYVCRYKLFKKPFPLIDPKLMM
jgi:hypothetical protein